MTSGDTGWTQLYANSGLLETIEGSTKMRAELRSRCAALQNKAVGAGRSTRRDDMEVLAILREYLNNLHKV